MCECKELIDKDESDKGFIWNPSNCKCECNKSCDIGEYLDYWNCKWRKKLVNKLTEECTENIEETKLVEKLRLKMYINVVLAQYALCYFGYFSYSLQITLELAFISHTTNIWVVIKKILNMMTLVKQQFGELINGTS